MSKVERKTEVIRSNFIDDVVGFFSPKAKAERLRYRAAASIMTRKYDGADSGRRTEGWITHGNSANAEIMPAIVKLRNRSRDLIRNNPYAKNGMRVITNEVVGKGISVRFKDGKSEELSAKERKINDLFRAWSETKACDWEGKKDIPALSRMIMRAVAESGEVLVRIRKEPYRTKWHQGAKYVVPAFSLQVLEADFLISLNNAPDVQKGNSIKRGIEYDPEGRIVAYHLYQSHPGESVLLDTASRKIVRIPAEEIYHIMDDEDRPGLSRGIPWLAPIMLRLRDFDLFEDATLKRQQCAAMFTAFVHDDELPDDLAPTSTADVPLGERMEPGIIELLPAGKKVTLSDPPGAEGYDSYTSTILHSIANGLGITFSALTGNLREVNFSSGRMGALQMNRNVAIWREEIIIRQFLAPMADEFLNECTLLGISIKEIGTKFTAPKRELIDPKSETKADIDQVRAGFKTFSTLIEEYGNDPDIHYEELAKDQKMIDKFGLALDIDPRQEKTAKAEAPSDSAAT